MRSRDAKLISSCAPAMAAAFLTSLAWAAASHAQPSAPNDAVAPDRHPLARRYAPGQVIRYVMNGSHAGRESTTKYSAEAEARVVLDADGKFYEEARWTRLEVNGKEVALDDATRNFQQRLSLDPGYEMPMPDVRGVNPMLMGPIFDLMTFYVDLHANLHQGRLQKAGDQVFVPHGQPNSWADGMRIILGQDCIDFDLTLMGVSDKTAELRVRHVPPKETRISLPAPWMRTPVGDTANNWVQVQKESGPSASQYIAAVGKETFEVRLVVDRETGGIRTATMENPVDVVQRRCRDEALTDCDEPMKYRILRRVELRARD